MLNIVVPMAGRGSRFANAGYKMPKPLIDIHGHYMIECVTKNIAPRGEHRFIYLCLAEHLEKYDLAAKLRVDCAGLRRRSGRQSDGRSRLHGSARARVHRQ